MALNRSARVKPSSLVVNQMIPSGHVSNRSFTSTSTVLKQANPNVLTNAEETAETSSLSSVDIPELAEPNTPASLEDVLDLKPEFGEQIAKLMTEYEAAKASGEIAIPTYEALFEKLSEIRAFNQAHGILVEMRAAGLKPSAKIYGHVLKSGRRALRVAEIRELFGHKLEYRGGVEVELEDHDSTVKRSPLFETMKQVRAWMDEEQLKLEDWFWDDTAGWLAGIKHAGLLINIAVAMEARGITPSVNYYAKMLYCLPRCGFADRADVLFSRLVLNNLVNANVYNIRLGSLIYMGRTQEAENLFKEFCTKFKLDTVAYNTMIHGHLEAGKLEKALALFEQMKVEPDTKPNEITAHTFLTYFYESGNVSQVNNVLAYFKESINFPSSSDAYAHLIKFFGRFEPSRACQMLIDVVKNTPNFDLVIYNTVLNLLTDRRVDAEWKRTIGDAIMDQTYHLQAGKLSEKCSVLPFHVRHLIARMEHYSIAPNSITFDLIIRGLLTRKQFDLVMELYQLMEKQAIPLYSSHRNAYLSALICSSAPREEIEKYLALMKFRRWPVSSVNNRRLQELDIKIPSGSFVYPRDKVSSKQSGREAMQKSVAPSFSE